jgi:uncharacterized protein
MRSFVAACAVLLGLGVATGPLAQPAHPATVVGTPTDISEGQRFTLHSAVLDEDRIVFISTPPSYNRDSQRRFPVLYLTDGQFNFDDARASAGFLSRNVVVPQMIVVGVTTIKDRTRDLYSTKADFKFGKRTTPFPTSGNGDHFLEFIQSELIPWVEGNYRTNSLRVFAGHSAGGNFALHAMRTKPMLFQGVIAISPWLSWDNHRELHELRASLATAKTPVRALYFSYTDPVHDGPEMKGDIQALSAALKARNDPALRWATATYPGETHDVTFVKAFFDGLQMIFAGYEFPRDPETNILVGSLDDVKTHYAKVSGRLGASLPPPSEILDELGYRDLRQGRVDTAVAAFRFEVELYPQSPGGWDSLGDGLEGAHNMDEALRARRKAEAVAEANHDPAVESYRRRTRQLVDRMKALAKP